MRDPKRIKRILKLIEQVWIKVPDFRLSQLIVNISQRNDPFYYEDDDLEKRLKLMLKPEQDNSQPQIEDQEWGQSNES